MKTLIKSIATCALFGAAISANADTTVTVDNTQTWLGYMNVSEIPANGGGYVFGSSWGTADLVATFSGSTLTLAPNVIGDPNPFWYTPAGGPGSVGNKMMDASMYVEPAGSLPGQTVTFKGVVTANTLVGHVDATGNGWTAVAFIKDFAPDFSSFVSTTVALAPGAFSISLATIADPARHVQYGFETIGPDVWVTDVGPYGTIVVNPASSAPNAVTISPSLSGGTLKLSFPTQTGFIYTVQYKTNLTDVSWNTLTTTNGTGSVAVPTASANAPKRFYRVSIQ